MFKYLYILIFPYFFGACNFVSTSAHKNSIAISFNNLPLDSVHVRLLYYMEGRDVIDTVIAPSDTIFLNGLKEDMYLLAVSWNRTIIPHHIVRNKSFNKDEGEEYTFTKAFYINPLETRDYHFYLDSIYSVEDIESNNIRDLRVDTSKSLTLKIANDFWDTYNSYFLRKQLLIDELNKDFYTENDRGSLKNYRNRDLFLKLDSVKNDFRTDRFFKEDFNNLVNRYYSNRVTTFFVFYQLYLERDFEKYLTNFHQLEGDAVQSKYYKMIAKQYDNVKW